MRLVDRKVDAFQNPWELVRLLDLTGDVIAWRRADEPAAADIRASVTDLLLAIYRRRRVGGVHVTGDAKLVDFWLERVAFG